MPSPRCHFSQRYLIYGKVKSVSRSVVFRLFATAWTRGRLPDSSVHRILQARILEWVALSFSRVSSLPRNGTWVFCIGRWILYYWVTYTSIKQKKKGKKLKQIKGGSSKSQDERITLTLEMVEAAPSRWWVMILSTVDRPICTRNWSVSAKEFPFNTPMLLEEKNKIKALL